MVAGVLMLAGTALAAGAPAPETVQGLYAGTWKDARGAAEAEVRCVALGKDDYRLLVRRTLNGTVARAEVPGKAEAGKGTVAFAGKCADVAWAAEWTADAIRGTIGADGALEVKRVKKTPPTLGKRPTEGAVVLLDGKNFDHMRPRGAKPPPGNKAAATPPASPWGTIGEDGSIQIPRGGMESVATFAGSYDVHVEFLCPLQPGARGQGRGNSGCYQPCGQEIQVLDSFGMETYKGGGCGGLYGKKDPDTMEPIPSLADKKENVFTLASLPPLEWQTYDIEFRVKEQSPGQKVGRLTVYHNGVRIHDNVELKCGAGRFFFQDHGNPVRYRNIWVVERKD
jgi:hypothetical protein